MLTISSMILLAVLTLLVAACTSAPAVEHSEADTMNDAEAASAAPPERIRAWMDRLTVDHEYDPATGFIVAREVVELPEVVSSGPPVREAISRGVSESRAVVVFATADRCAPCQQYKRSAIGDPAVIAALADPGLIVTHVEVDRETEAAGEMLGSLAIPMTYLFRDGVIVSELRGQRSADELLAWLEAAN